MTEAEPEPGVSEPRTIVPPGGAHGAEFKETLARGLTLCLPDAEWVPPEILCSGHLACLTPVPALPPTPPKG